MRKPPRLGTCFLLGNPEIIIYLSISIYLCSFAQLIFSTSGGVSPLTKRFLQQLATKLSEKKFGNYAQALCWLRTRLAFTIAKAGSMCLRACRSRRSHLQAAVSPVSALSAAKLIYLSRSFQSCLTFMPFKEVID